MIDKEGTLPDTLHELLTVALADFKRAEAAKHMHINMNEWHVPGYVAEDVFYESDGCTVCVAGAVIAFSLGAEPDEALTAYSYDQDTERKLRAINYLRLGWVEAAWEARHGAVMGGVPVAVDAVNRRFVAPHYYRDPKGWWKVMGELRDALKAEGL